MQELEKILEEMEEESVGIGAYYVLKEYRDEEDLYVSLSYVKDIIRKHMNDGWIPVEERLPEDDEEVLITYVDVVDEEEMGIDITTYGYATLGGNRLSFKEWRNPFRYFNGNYKVIAWRPLPEPYRPERSEE